MIRVTLIDPRGSLEGLNTGLGYLAGSLLSSKFCVEVMDFNNYPQRLCKRLRGINSDIVGISVKSATLAESVKIAKLIKTNFKRRITIVAGGVCVTLLKSTFLEKYPVFDLGIIGEGEYTFVNTLRTLYNREPLESIKGLVYKTKRGVKFTGSSSYLKDLDSLPFPRYDIFDSVKLHGVNIYPLVTSRGCPYKCKFCVVPSVSGKEWRARSVYNIIEELREAVQRYEIKFFRIKDDNFTLDKQRVIRFCRALIESGLDLKWGCITGFRADKIDKEIVKMLKMSNCKYISIGIESLDNRVFSNLDKRESLEEVKLAVKLFKEHGIKVIGQFITGLPYSNYGKDYYTFRESIKLGLDGAIFNYFVPYPYTPIWEEVASLQRDTYKWEGCSSCVDIKPNYYDKHYTFKEKARMYYESNLYYRNYHLVVPFNESFWKRFVRLFLIILLYDIKHIGKHIFYLMRKLLKKIFILWN